MNGSDVRRRLLAQRIRGGGTKEPPAPGPTGARREPASFSQRRLWFVEQLQQVDAPYTLHAARRAAFPLDPGQIAACLSEIAARHESLRTSFRMVDQDLVQVIDEAPKVEPQVVDLTGLPEDAREAAAVSAMADVLARRFDLAEAPLMRVRLLKLGAANWLMLVAVHHLVFDGPSFDVFFRELDALYGARAAGQPSPLPPVSAQYAEFAREQRARLTPERIERETEFWRGELDGLSLLDLPTDRPRRIEPTFRGALHRVEIAPALVRRLQERAVSRRSSLFAALLAGYWAMLARLCRETDFGVGLPVTGRDTMARKDAIGFFVDTVVTRLRPGADPTGDEVLAAARDAVGRSLAHKTLPFDLIVERLGPERDLGVNPFFQVGFQFMEYFTSKGPGDVEVPRASAMFEVGLDLWFEEEAIAGRFEYNSDLFDHETIVTMERVFRAALEWLVDGTAPLHRLSPGAVLDASELSVLTGPALPLDERTCVDLLEETARSHPDALALVGGEVSFGYAGLLVEVERLARHLFRRGVGPGGTILLEIDRSPELVLLQLAALRLGASFATADPGWPDARRQTVRSALSPALVVDATVLEELSGEAPTARLPSPPAADDRAYVIFTSGSTGTPKGVEVEHRGLLNVALAQRESFGLGPGRRVLQLSSPTFDASIFETVLALTSGATLVVAPCGVIAGEALADLIDRQAIDTIVTPPSVLATLPQGRGAGLRMICVAGESCPADLAARFSGAAFHNLYGPTETTIWATWGERVDGARVAIGRPIANTTTLVVDESLGPVPVGVAGELCIAGPGVARGYLDEPARTAEAFRADLPGVAGRVYRTGDLVRQTRAGDLVFLGRADRQVKIRGLRIELEEVERVLRAEPGVTDVIADTAEIGGQTVLVAYLQCDLAAAEAIVEACRQRLRSRLPAFMAPSRFVPVAIFPRSQSGKVDRNAMPAPAEKSAADGPYTAPATATEKAIAEVMAHVLRLPRVGAEDDFFHIGGHSLAAVQVAARATTVLGVDLAILDVFAHSTVRALATLADARRGEARQDDANEVPLVRLPRGGPDLHV